MAPGAHDALKAKLIAIVRGEREGAIEKAKVTRQLVAVHGIKDRFTEKRRTGPLTLDPATPRGATNRAYNHAAMLALHEFGVVDYDFKMSDAQKAELEPLSRFMWHVKRRLVDEMNIATKPSFEAKAPYRAEFGQKFPDGRLNDDGSVRVRVRPNQQFVKYAPSRVHEQDEPGRVDIGGDWPMLRIPPVRSDYRVNTFANLPLAKAAPIEVRLANLAAQALVGEDAGALWILQRNGWRRPGPCRRLPRAAGARRRAASGVRRRPGRRPLRRLR